MMLRPWRWVSSVALGVRFGRHPSELEFHGPCEDGCGLYVLGFRGRTYRVASAPYGMLQTLAKGQVEQFPGTPRSMVADVSRGGWKTVRRGGKDRYYWRGRRVPARLYRWMWHPPDA